MWTLRLKPENETFFACFLSTQFSVTKNGFSSFSPTGSMPNGRSSRFFDFSGFDGCTLALAKVRMSRASKTVPSFASTKKRSDSPVATGTRGSTAYASFAPSSVCATTRYASSAETAMRNLLDRWLADRNFVTREEFDAVRAMAQKAREENEALKARLDAVEAAGRQA